MFELTQNAQKELNDYFGDKEKASVRVYLAGGCGGPHLALALDDPTDEDSVFTEGGFSFCIEKALLGVVESVKIDGGPMGFLVDTGKPLPSMGGGCGGCCSSSSGGCGSGCGD